MNDVIIDPNDYKYFEKNPGKDFNPARNKAIINETIQETTKYFQQLNEFNDDEFGDRVDILSSYGRYRLGGKGFKTFESWGGKELVNRVIGEKILAKVRVADTVNKLQNNRKKSIIL